MGSAMERAPSAHASGNRRVVAWLPEMDRILIVGMKHGSQGIREATNKVLALRAGMTRADCWKRLRLLRETGNGSYPAPRSWPAEVKELLREGYQQAGEKKREAIKAHVRTDAAKRSASTDRLRCAVGATAAMTFASVVALIVDYLNQACGQETSLRRAS